VAETVTFQSKRLEAKITGNVVLDTDGSTTIESGDVFLTSTGSITLGGSSGVFYPAAKPAAGIIAVNDAGSQLCSGYIPIPDPLDSTTAVPPAMPVPVLSNMLGTMAIKKFGDNGDALTHICALFPFSKTTKRPILQPSDAQGPTDVLPVPVWLPLRTNPPATPYLKLDGTALF
jgi:hypothetical protein